MTRRVPRGAGHKSGFGRGSGSKWTCNVCTYADNKKAWLRCEVCNGRRLDGMGTFPYRGPLKGCKGIT